MLDEDMSLHELLPNGSAPLISLEEKRGIVVYGQV
jgi:hypothetical protein